MTKNNQFNDLHILSQLYHRNGKQIVLATGVFDLLHKEHIKFLKLAKKQGDVLFVGIETDDRVKQLKGKKRPIYNLKTRFNNLKKISIINEVFILPDNLVNTAVQKKLIAAIRPNVYAVSSHTPFLSKKKKIVEQFGGKLVIVHQYNDQISTTKIIRLTMK